MITTANPFRCINEDVIVLLLRVISTILNSAWHCQLESKKKKQIEKNGARPRKQLLRGESRLATEQGN